MPNGRFTEVSCAPAPCNSIEIEHSNRNGNNPLVGNFGDIQQVICDEPYIISNQELSSNYFNNRTGYSTCQEDGSFSNISCIEAGCIPTQIENSNYSAPGSISGGEGSAFEVICNEGYIGGGTVTCESNGVFTIRNCFAANLVPTKNNKSHIYSGRYYLVSLLKNIYDYEDEDIKNIIHENILTKPSFFGDPCDPFEEFSATVNLTNYVAGEDPYPVTDFRKCHNDLFNSHYKTNPGLLREGWRIATCNQLNENFQEDTKPLSLIHQLFDSIDINENSIKYAYHLFNPFLSLPNEAINNLKFMFSEDNQEAPNSLNRPELNRVLKNELMNQETEKEVGIYF